MRGDWTEVQDGVASGGDATLFVVDNPLPAPARLFYRVRELP